MLRLAKLTDAEYVLNQVAAGLEDYYLGAGEAPGVWAGGLARELGLQGMVAASDLRGLIDQTDPTTGVAWGGRKRPTVRAIDATFSAPKSVSLLWAFAGTEVASAVSIAHVEAVAAALEFVESRAAVTRRQIAGTRARAVTSGWAAATFGHRTSRAGDPQLHTHCVIANVVHRGDDGAWVALDATVLYRWAKAAGSIYQEELRRRLSDRLGVGWGPDRNGCREMTGITETQLRAFSKRTVQIEAHLAAHGGAPADPKARMRADELASVATRPRKDRTLTPVVLRSRWDREAERVDLPFGPALLKQVRAAKAHRQVDHRDVRALFDRLVDPEVGLCAHDSRFGEAQVIEAIAAWGAGRLAVADVEFLTRVFLRSDRVVRLVSPATTGRAAGQWSTVAHRSVEDRVLASLAALRARPGLALDPSAVAAAIEGAVRLGDDQAPAVAILAGPGPALRALVAPAGHGKTTTLATAVDAARRAGRPVLALSTTNQAVDQLRQVGIPAVTVARFALERTELEPGCVVIVDECSQLPTHEADTILAAATACPDSQVWLVGDPLQTQPVRAGGLAPWLADQIEHGKVSAAELTVNRRQADARERQALTDFRSGAIDDSQQLRDTAGWEHHQSDTDQAMTAMAAAVLADLEVHEPDRVAALAVTHAECEQLADRIRADLTDAGAISGPTLEGPGWYGPRAYQAGDRILLHAHADLDDGRRLTNGTTATVTHVNGAALTILADHNQQPARLPVEFVTGRGPDGRPQVSHAWVRTIDGVQGGTWEQVHLLATPAIDRYRGYVGQSRSIQPTHTWNTTPAPSEIDHGGRLVEPAHSPAEQIAAALARAQPKTFAAGDDPYRIERVLRAAQTRHQAQLDQRPPDVGDRLAAARSAVAQRRTELAAATDTLAYWQHQQQATAGIHGLTPGRRRRHTTATARIAAAGLQVERANTAVDNAIRDVEQVQAQADARRAFDQENQWRIEWMRQLKAQLERHWTVAVIDAARDGHPYAYGPSLLRQARQTLIDQINTTTMPSARGAANPQTARIGDPLLALTDLDRAVKQAAAMPDSELARQLDASTRARYQTLRQHPATPTPLSPSPRPPTIHM